MVKMCIDFILHFKNVWVTYAAFLFLVTAHSIREPFHTRQCCNLPKANHCVFLEENWKGILRGLGRATLFTCLQQKAAFSDHSTHETWHCVLARGGAYII